VNDEDPFVLLVTGGRDAGDRYEVIGYLTYVLQVPRRYSRRVVVRHGDCKTGVDAYAKAWADETALLTGDPHPAENHGSWPACGPRRNSHMVSLGADLCLALPTRNSRGTWDCAEKAAKAGIPVRLWTVAS